MTKNTPKSNGRKHAPNLGKSSHLSHDVSPTADPTSKANRKRTRAAQKNTVNEHYEQLTQSTSEMFEEARAKLGEAKETLKEYSNELAENVRKKPLMSILIAGSIGFILSSLFRK
ncbi:Bacterial protein of uncharacterised function (DUF883) [Legionella lansingensis]|uniref:DUF883 domain-containing protein n=1 Tax=Legionella lansingensis TaxID=45067 RepID=A0A0W0VIJ4_9GAMM|nr:hypothetical protein [Legionella lansingensis]KTD19950.1 hypothetical protein Llan_2045 [Legionella lansingensis]SNV48541.1 Bacterial protein of uncharacterised function (DUF883) [Legionella lansingensis]